MKYLIMLLALSSCGLQNQIDNLKYDNAENAREISDLARRVSILEADLALYKASLTSVSNRLIALEQDSNSQESDIQAAQNQIQALQLAVNTSLVQLGILQGYKNIVAVKDPCGAQNANNEVFLQLSDGRYLASFSDNASGQNTRFSLLSDGNYVTTDGTHCYFTVSNNGTVISNEHN